MIRNAILSCPKGKYRFLKNISKDDSVQIFLKAGCIQTPESQLLGREMHFPSLNTEETDFFLHSVSEKCSWKQIVIATNEMN